MNVRIVVADDQLLVLEALAEILDRVDDFDVVGLASKSDHIVETVQRVLPTVTVMGMGSAGCDGLSIAAEIRRQVPTCGIALTVADPTRALVDRAVEAGVLSIVPKCARMPYLIGAIRGAAAGCYTIDPRLFHTPKADHHPLSDREIEVLRLTSTGASVKDMAKKLFLAEGTVRNLASGSIKKLAARNRFDAARIAGVRGWI